MDTQVFDLYLISTLKSYLAPIANPDYLYVSKDPIEYHTLYGFKNYDTLGLPVEFTLWDSSKI